MALIIKLLRLPFISGYLKRKITGYLQSQIEVNEIYLRTFSKRNKEIKNINLMLSEILKGLTNEKR